MGDSGVSNVTIRNVGKLFGGHRVMQGVSIEVASGEFVALVGPSGCGKSTLLRMIAGLESVTEGDLEIGGRRVNDIAPKDRDIAMVFQNYALYPHMTVRENMAFSLKLAGTARQVIETKVKRAAEMLDLVALLDRYPRQLSGGQRQRVAMGRAVVRNPQVFLFDEPLSNLDALLRGRMRSEIKELHQRLGTTTIYVTHDQVEAMSMADKIVVMRAGVIEQIGRPLDVYDRPANLFVAGFIGSPPMNILPGRIRDGRFVGDQVEIALPTAAATALEGRRVRLGFRAEDITRTATGIVCEALVVEPTGSEVQVTARAGGATVICMFRDRYMPAPGERFSITVDPSRVHLFLEETGERVDSL